MTDPNSDLIISAAALAAIAMLAAAALAGWRGWLALKTRELDQRGSPMPAPGAGTRIELADLKERIRKLEAIAAGVEL